MFQSTVKSCLPAVKNSDHSRICTNSKPSFPQKKIAVPFDLILVVIAHCGDARRK
jgi:hypothetical protein